MSNRYAYQVRFLSADGGPVKSVAVLAQSLTVAIDCGSAIGAEIGAAIFYIVPRLEARNQRPNAVTRRKPDIAPYSDVGPSAL